MDTITNKKYAKQSSLPSMHSTTCTTTPTTTTTHLPTFDEILQRAVDAFQHTFNGKEPTVASCAPGRVNLIGEHIDYNDGFVLPMALPMVTIMLGSPNGTTDRADIRTMCDGADLPHRVSIDLNDLQPGEPKWANYVKGVIHHYGKPVPGFDAVVVTNVPIGGGLSSSAALEVATLTFIESLVDSTSTTKEQALKHTEKALICQKAEHQYAGMPCGIMDQLVSVMGKQRHALLIDCQSLDTFHIPFESDDLAVLICNSNVRHELSNSQYPLRRAQCAEALRLMGLDSYKDATMANLDALKKGREVLMKRARHVISETKRTQEAAEALKRRDFIKMGKLMTESHKSLRDDFEVSCKELDVLVEAAIGFGPAVLGSRMTGGGFGGCTVTLVSRLSVESLIQRMTIEYARHWSRTATFYVSHPSNGAQIIDLKKFLEKKSV